MLVSGWLDFSKKRPYHGGGEAWARPYFIQQVNLANGTGTGFTEKPMVNRRTVAASRPKLYYWQQLNCPGHATKTFVGHFVTTLSSHTFVTASKIPWPTKSVMIRGPRKRIFDHEHKQKK